VPVVTDPVLKDVLNLAVVGLGFEDVAIHVQS